MTFPKDAAPEEFYIEITMTTMAYLSIKKDGIQQ